MSERNLTDPQWCVLDLLMRARAKGQDRLHRMEMLESSLPSAVSVKLCWAALTMPVGLVEWLSKHEFQITEEGIQLYRLKFGKVKPVEVADSVICLPGPEAYRQ